MDTIASVATSTPRIWWIGGSKGGVGKSMLAASAVDYFLHAGQPVTLVECDTSNPDVGKAYEALVHSMELVDLDERDGWLRLIDVCAASRDNVVVINTPARNNVAVNRYGELLDDGLEELGKMVALWVINRQRDSLELLREFMAVVKRADVHVVRNGYFGKETQFEIYNGSNVRTAIESRGGKSVTLPDLADRVADDLYSRRVAISVAAKELSFGNRVELLRWRRAVHGVLKDLVA